MPEDDDKIFKKIEDEAKAGVDFTKGLLDTAEADREHAVYEENQKTDKQILREMAMYYGAIVGDQKELGKILGNLDRLANIDANSSTGKEYEKEWKLYNQVCNDLTTLQKKLDEEELAIHQMAEKQLKKTDRDGNRVWLTDAEIDANPKLKELNRKLQVAQTNLEDQRRIATDIQQHMEIKRDGNLDVEEELKKTYPENLKPLVVSTVGMNFDVADYDEEIANRLYVQKDLRDVPLFPHEPNPNDIQQGALGDCYYLAGLQNMARLHPESIKNAMRDNRDGTVTVRFFSRNSSQGGYRPIFVTVDKVVPANVLAPNSDIGSAENCLWVNCYERALAASGLWSGIHLGHDDPSDLPDDVNDPGRMDVLYEEAKRALGAIPNLHTWEKIVRQEKKTKKPYVNPPLSKEEQERIAKEVRVVQRKYPWFFTTDGTARIVKWPNYDSIQGGDVSLVTELLEGEGFRPSIIRVSPDQRMFLNYTFTNPGQFVALTFGLTDKEMLTDYYGAGARPVEFTGTNREMFEKVWDKLYLTAGENGLLHTERLKILSTQLKDEYAGIGMNAVLTKDEFIAFLENGAQAIQEEIERRNLEMTHESILNVAAEITLPVGRNIPQGQPIPQKDYFFAATFASLRDNVCHGYEQSRYTSEELNIYETIREGERKRLPMGAGARKEKDQKKYTTTGEPLVIGQHAYSVLGVYEENGHKFVKMRNPHGDESWNSKTTFDEQGSKTYERTNSEQGVFSMELADFTRAYRSILINGLHNDNPKIGELKSDFQIGMLPGDREVSLPGYYLTVNKILFDAVGMTDEEKEAFIYHDMPQIKVAGSRCSSRPDRYMMAVMGAMSGGDLTRLGKDFNIIMEQITHPDVEEAIKAGKGTNDLLNALNTRLEAIEAQLGQLGKDTVSRMLFVLKTDREGNTGYKELKDRMVAQREGDPNFTGPFDEIKNKFEEVNNLNDNHKLYIYRKGEDGWLNRHEIVDVQKRVNPVSGRVSRVLYYISGDNTRNEIRYEDYIKEGWTCESVDIEIDKSAIEERRVQKLEERKVDSTAVWEDQERIDFKSYHSYLKVLTDISKTFAASKTMFDGTSEEFKNLMKKLTVVKANVARGYGHEFQEVRKQIQSLTPELDKYAEHCILEYRSGTRRETRQKACNILRDLIFKAERGDKDPCEQIEKEYLKKAAEVVAKNRNISSQGFSEKMEHAMHNETIRGAIKNMNVYDLQNATEESITKQLKAIKDKDELNDARERTGTPEQIKEEEQRAAEREAARRV